MRAGLGAEHGQEAAQDVAGGGLVERQAEPVGVDQAQVDAGVAGGDQQRRGRGRGPGG